MDSMAVININNNINFVQLHIFIKKGSASFPII